MSGERVEQHAWSLRVGVTGHRLSRLDRVDMAALSRAVHSVLAQIAALVPKGAQIHLLSSLADGADSIAADAALALGWTLDAILPLPVADYAVDFADGAPREAFHARLERAGAVLQLPTETDREIAYERAGRVVLAQSDLLLTIWDGEPARGRGGSGQIIAEAAQAEMPIVRIDPAAPEAPWLLWDDLLEHDFGRPDLDDMTRHEMDRLPQLIGRLAAPPTDAFGMSMLAEVAAAEPRRGLRVAVAYPLLLMVMGVRRLRIGDVAGQRVMAPAGGDALDRWFTRADEQASISGQYFRSAYVINYSLAAFAVTASLARLILPGPVHPVLAVLEFSAILAILLVTRHGRRMHWHRRWLDQRHLAERLRCLLVTRRLGQLQLRRKHADEADWVAWTTCALSRMAGVRSALIDETYLRSVRTSLGDLIDDQLAYLTTDAHRMHLLEHRLHRLGTFLFVTTAVICLVMFVLEVLLHTHLPPLVASTATVASAALPACGAAIYGIRMQGDFAGIAERNGAVAGKLRTLRDVLADEPLSFDGLWDCAEQAREVLTQDVQTWLHAYRARPLALPG